MRNSFLKKFFLTAATVACISPSAYAEPETISINVKTSHYMNMNRQIKRIAVGNPDIASVIQLSDSASEFLIVAKANSGSTSLFVWTADDVRYEYLVVVSPEDPGQAMMIQQAIGLPDVHVKMIGNRIMLTGSVENQYEKNYVLQTARLFVNGGTDSSILVGSGFNMKLDVQNAKSSSSSDIDASKSETSGTIIDLLQIRHPTQIRLEAQIIEINSDDAKELGIQYGTSGSGGTFYFGENYSRADEPREFRNNPARWVEQHFSPINATITALVTNGKARILSRPSVMTLSGEQATIQIGGEIPYTSYSDNGRPVVEFKDYGIILQFKPVVDAQNRINSMIHTEVSNLSGQTVDSQPIISTRRADSVINLRSGSPIVIGGLMDSSETKNVSKIPLLGDIPILGEFFKHTSKSRDKREIIIVVTPYLVETNDLSKSEMSNKMRDWYEQAENDRDNMRKVDFKKSDDDILTVKEPKEHKRILPPSRLPYNGREISEPFKN